MCPSSLILLLAAELAAFWPVWRWLALRLGDGGAESLGLAPLVTAGAALALPALPASADRAGGGREGGEWKRQAPALAILLYGLSYPFLPPLGRALVAALALAATVGAGDGRRLGLFVLLALALPIVPTLQFYAGFPLRVITTSLAAGLLQLAGWAVHPAGTTLVFGEATVAVDAPCAGVRMLWGLCFLSGTLLAFRPLPLRRATALLGLALALVLAGNAVRTAALFLFETDVLPELPPPPWMHDAVGLVVFALLAAVLVAAHRANGAPAPSPPAPGGVPRLALLACVLVALLPWAVPERAAAILAVPFPGWPATWNGRPLAALPLTQREIRFAAGFPGRVGRFSDGAHEIILRWIAAPSRQVHPAADCFRAWGYDAESSPHGPAGRSCFVARRDGLAMRVCEQITDGRGGTWPDVSAWYWAAALGRSAGPWWHAIVAQAESEP